MAEPAPARRKLIELDVGHLPESGAEAAAIMAVISGEILAHLGGDARSISPPPLGWLGAKIEAEWRRVRSLRGGGGRDVRALDRAARSALLSLSGPYLGTSLLRLFGLAKVPLILFAGPSLLEWSDEACAVRIALCRRTRNHLGSMYFGALAVGADVACGLLAQRHILRSGHAIGLVFKGVEVKFLRRPTGDVVFRSGQGVVMAALVSRAIELRQRVEDTVDVVATSRDEGVVAHFRLVISLKLKHARAT